MLDAHDMGKTVFHTLKFHDLNNDNYYQVELAQT